jgi:hypothetical protein
MEGAPEAKGGIAAPGAGEPAGPGAPLKYPGTLPPFGAAMPASVLPIVSPFGTPALFGTITPPFGLNGSVRPACVPVIPRSDRGSPVIDGAAPAIRRAS